MDSKNNTELLRQTFEDFNKGLAYILYAVVFQAVWSIIHLFLMKRAFVNVMESANPADMLDHPGQTSDLLLYMNLGAVAITFFLLITGISKIRSSSEWASNYLQ
jgi:hypothetical protein